MVGILAKIGWCAICFLLGGLGRWVAASMALATSEAVTLGVCIGLVLGVLLMWLAQVIRSID